MKTKLSELVSKITYSDSANVEILTSIIQNTKRNMLELVKHSKAFKQYSDKKIQGILDRKSNIKGGK